MAAGLNFSKIIPWKYVAYFLIGVAILVALIISLGASLIGNLIAAVGLTFVAVLIVSFFYYFLKTLAWQI